MSKKVIVSGVGCCLVDRIYNDIDFTSEKFGRYVSKTPGDGGMIPGKLEFEENFQQFANRKFPEVLAEITGGKEADSVNIGGPCIVALINAAQLEKDIADVRYYGCYGDDEVGEQLNSLLAKTPVNTASYRMIPGSETASTSVFSDPAYDNGQGERIFVNTIGASWVFGPQDMTDNFKEADICMFGATALVPKVHESLHTLIPAAKQKGALTMVTTVYDTLNERKNLDRWPLGGNDESYASTDLLVTDHEEAIRLSGTRSIEEALEFFQQKGVGATVVTNGSRNVYLYADSPIFGQIKPMSIPVSAEVGKRIKEGQKGDTTGCGDNFAGGVLASLIEQKHKSDSPKLDLMEACKWGVVSGGFACFYLGGTYYEERPGEKREQLEALYQAYNVQLHEAGLE